MHDAVDSHRRRQKSRSVLVVGGCVEREPYVTADRRNARSVTGGVRILVGELRQLPEPGPARPAGPEQIHVGVVPAFNYGQHMGGVEIYSWRSVWFIATRRCSSDAGVTVSYLIVRRHYEKN